MTRILLCSMAALAALVACENKANKGSPDLKQEKECFSFLSSNGQEGNRLKRVEFIAGDCYGDLQAVTKYSSSETVRISSKSDGLSLTGSEESRVYVDGDHVAIKRSGDYQVIGEFVMVDGTSKIKPVEGVSFLLAVEDEMGNIQKWSSSGEETSSGSERIWIQVP